MSMSDFWSWYHDNGIIPNLWKGFTGQASQEKQNAQNLDFQRDVLDYQKQLQQDIFAREDTAFTRAYEDASKFGLNPMSMVGVGAQSGSVVPVSAPQSNVDYSQFSGLKGLDSAISALGVASEVSSAINEVKTGNIQRDILQQEQLRSKLENALFAYENGLIVNKDGSISISDDSPLIKKTIQESENKSREASTRGQQITNERNQRVNEFQNKYGVNDTTTPTFKSASDFKNFYDENSGTVTSLKDAFTRWITEDTRDLETKDLFYNDYSDLNALKGTLSNYSSKIKNYFSDKKEKFNNWRNKNKMRLDKAYNH